MAKGRLSTVLVVAATAVLLAGPGLALQAALPCNAGEPMACCGGPDGQGAPHTPCGCSLSPVAPSQAVVEGPSPVVVLELAPAPALVEPAGEPLLLAAAVDAKARAAPLFLLFAAFLN